MAEETEGVPVRVALSEADFRKLVRGETVIKETITGKVVELILSDIGWGRIYNAVDTAYQGRPR